MSAPSLFYAIGNQLYNYAFLIYRPLYAAYKPYTDRAERELLGKILFAGAVAVDAGANIGIYSQFLSRCVGPKRCRPFIRAFAREFQTIACRNARAFQCPRLTSSSRRV